MCLVLAALEWCIGSSTTCSFLNRSSSILQSELWLCLRQGHSIAQPDFALASGKPFLCIRRHPVGRWAHIRKHPAKWETCIRRHQANKTCTILRTAPRDHQPPTTNRHQPPTATYRQPPAATNRQPPTTANRHQPAIPNHQLPPTTINHHQPPSTVSRQPPTANRQHMVCPWAFLGNVGTGTLLFFVLRQGPPCANNIFFSPLTSPPFFFR